jgi:hypothetical protein
MDTATPPRVRTGNLTAALVAVGLLELFLNRVAGRLFVPRATGLGGGSGSAAGHLLGAIGPFLFELTAVLALAVFVSAFTGLVRRRELYPRALRFSVVIIGLVFAGVSLQALVRGHVAARGFLYLETSVVFLAVLTAAAFAGSAASWRAKLGVALFALPGVLHAIAVVGPTLPGTWNPDSPLAFGLGDAGEVALLVATLTAPFLLPPRPWRERRWRLPLAVSAAVTALFIGALGFRYDLLQAAALYGLRMDLPRLDSLAGAAHVLALGGWTYATVELCADKGGMRLAGYGLLLLALGGYEPASPVELSLSLLGLVALAVGELRAVPYTDRTRPRVGAPEWRAYVGRLATAIGDRTSPDDAPPEAVLVEEGEAEVSRIRTHRRGYPISVRLLRRRGTLVELDATVGSTGRASADASIERHRRWLARHPEHRLKLERTKTGDAVFDQRFSVHGRAPLSDPELRRRLLRGQGDGVVTLWSGSAARYVLSSPSSLADAPPPFAGSVDGNEPVDMIVEMLDTLADLIEASQPAAAS